jgi:hypothetical protein
MNTQLEMFCTGATPYMVRTAKREQDVHRHSIEGYHASKGAISRRAMLVLQVLRESRVAMTDREVMRSLGFSDPNSVRPRITELIDAGIITEAGKTKDELTGKTVRKVMA